MTPTDRPAPASVRDLGAPSPAEPAASDHKPAGTLPSARGAPTQGSEQHRSKPTPVRAMAATESLSGSAAEAEADEADFTVGEDAWTARTLGRSGGREAPQLLLVGFWREGAEQADHELEAMVVARSLSELSSDVLATALSRGREPPAPPGAPPKREDRGRGRRR